MAVSPRKPHLRPHPARPRPRTTPRPTPDHVPPGLRTAAGYAWRLLLLGLAAYLTVSVLALLQLPVIALFLALVATSVLRPAVDLLDRLLPRALAVLLAYLAALAVVAGVLVVVSTTVAGEWGRLGDELHSGLARIDRWLTGAPFHLHAGTVSDLRTKLDAFVSSHRSALISTALSGASHAVEAVTAIALALFCSVFFLHSGDRMWHWVTEQLPARSRPAWLRAGHAAWRAFAGYTRGILLVSASNAAMVGIALLALDVPLALPLTVLEFVAALVPLVGSPVALAVAAVVALAARGPVVALLVLALIVVIGQIEGHLLHPLVMGWSVRLHPVAVALAVIGGAVLAGVLGALVAVPVVSVAWAVVQELRHPPA
ncbi:AI-2E family transporter [Kitasatospora sp. MMS16-BH015]|uniref:AI-2E family transporter n=1 Tax=Kitasatospora sp. MMS16-BH015 TaxID=2018025 RepID=UPI000CA31C05|nr:AI-2E family transporter [Kitasatospora sp. MMS16-BH015]AUG81650.1 AI-2E family transporter [Kitasatospora sp. MMS16-BH015]